MKNRKIIGYQIKNRYTNEIPEGLWSFQVFTDLEDAKEYLDTKVNPSERDEYLIYNVRENDIENPSFIFPINKELTKQFGFTIRQSQNSQFPYYVECCDECMNMQELKERAADIRWQLGLYY